MGTEAEGQVDIILDANGAPVMRAIDAALKRMKDVQAVTQLIVNNAKAASAEFQKATNASFQGFEKALKRVEAFEAAMLRVNRQPISQANNDRLFAGQIANVAKFQIGLKEAANAAQAFQGRLNDMDRRLVQMGNSGNVSTGLLSRRLGLEQAQKDFQAVQREMNRMDAAARRSGISVDKTGYLTAEQSLFGALRQQKVNLGPYLSQLNKAADEYIVAVKAEQARIRRATNETAPPITPMPPAGGGGRGLFGATGLTGVVARTAAYGGAAALIFGAVSAMKTGITEAVKFDDTLHQIAGVAGLTSTQMAELGSTIEGVADHSKYARQEIAEATVVLAQAGFSASDIASSLQAINNLAAASGSSFAQVTDVMTSAIGAFQLNAASATQIADQLTAALNMTKLNIQQVALGIQYAGAAAYENNLTFQDLTATFAALAQAGIRSGSTMGTGIRQLLTDLLTPSKKMGAEMKKLGLTMDDINVKTLGLTGVIKNLQEAGFGAAEAYRGLEVRAAASYLALVNQQDVALKVAQAQVMMKGSTEAAAKATSSLAGQWQVFKNHLNNAVTEGIHPATQGLAQWLKGINGSAEAGREFDGVLASLNKQMNNHEISLHDVDERMQEYKDKREALITADEQHADTMERLNTTANKAQETLDHETQVLDSLHSAITRVSVRKEILTKDTVALATETLNLEGQFQGLAAMLQNTALSYDSLTAALMRYQKAQLGRVMADAANAYNAQDKIVHEANRSGTSALDNIKGSGLLGRLPKNIQQAINDAAGKSGFDRASALAVLQDYTGGSASKGLSANDRRMLSSYSTSVGQLGVADNNRSQAALLRDSARLLGGDVGMRLATDIQNIRTPEQGRAVLKDIANRMKGKTGAAANALGSLMQWAAQQTSMVEKPSLDPSKAKSNKGAEHAQDRRNLDIAKERQRADNMDLQNSIKDLTTFPHGSVSPDGDIVISAGEKELTPQRVQKNLANVSDKLGNWITGRMALMAAQIDRDDMGGADAASFKAQVMREIQEKKEETARAVAEQMAKGLDAMVKATEDVAAAAQLSADHALAMSQSRLKSLDRVAARGGNVPDYVRGHYERAGAVAQDKHDKAQIGINSQEIAGLNKDLSFWNDLMPSLQEKFKTAPEQLSVFTDKVRDIRLEITQLTNANEELGASFADIIPQDLKSNMDQMIEQWKQANGMTSSFNQDLADIGSKGLDAAYGAFTTFFSDVLTGTKSVTAAFGDMAKGIIKAMEQLAAELIAKQLFKFILSLVGGAAGDPGANSVGYIWNGGPAVKGAWGGEHIQGKIEGRDSVLRKLAPGEFVMRRAAVRSVGVAGMHKINEMGAAALHSSGPQQSAPVNQQVAVYVVKEGERPQMGPKDVLVAVHEDILKNGETKKLIKLVSQGA